MGKRPTFGVRACLLDATSDLNVPRVGVILSRFRILFDDVVLLIIYKKKKNMNCIFVKFVIFNRVIYLIVTFVILKKKKISY